MNDTPPPPYGCPQQPQYVPPPAPAPVKKARRWPWIAGIAFAFVLGNMSGHAGESSSSTTATVSSTPSYSDPSPPSIAAPVEAPEPAAPAIAAGTIPQGEWLVPDEVAPGRYRSAGAVEGLFELCSATTHSADGAVIDWKTANAGEQVIITVTSGAATISNSGCQTFTKID